MDNINKADLGNSLLEHGIFVPNWFDKEHFEEILDRELTDTEFAELCRYLWDRGIADNISEEVQDWLENYIDSDE